MTHNIVSINCFLNKLCKFYIWFSMSEFRLNFFIWNIHDTNACESYEEFWKNQNFQICEAETLNSYQVMERNIGLIWNHWASKNFWIYFQYMFATKSRQSCSRKVIGAFPRNLEITLTSSVVSRLLFYKRKL